ncbi:MAG: FHA domain-containing protein [Planctomycetota bacterium]
MICVLDVTAGPARGRRFWIRAREKLEIGRISTADFSVPSDRHMSRHHLILEGNESSFRIRDVGSANGTFVNNSKVSSIELCNGDLIKAGETVFEVSVIQDHENPHAKDVSFSASSKTDVSDSAINNAPPKEQIAVPDPHILDDESTSRVNDQHVVSPVESLSETAWWSELEFAPTDYPGLYLQRKGAEEDHSISVILKRLEPIFALTAIVYTEHLRRFDKELLDGLNSEGVVTQQSPSVCSVMNSCSRDFYMLAESLIGQDALMLLGTRSGLDPNIISDICVQCPRPTTMDSELSSQDSELRRKLRSDVDLVLYEFEQSARLKLMMRDIVR